MFMKWNSMTIRSSTNKQIYFTNLYWHISTMKSVVIYILDFYLISYHVKIIKKNY